MSDIWFKPKTYGYGATPANWKGWAATLAFMAAILAVTMLVLGWQPESASALPTWRFALWLGLVAALLVGFIALSRAKSDGQWAWRWGK